MVVLLRHSRFILDLFILALLQSIGFFMFAAHHTNTSSTTYGRRLTPEDRLGMIEQPLLTKDTAASSSIAHTAIFYNLFVATESDLTRVSRIIQEQFREVDPTFHSVVYVNSIGAHVPSLSNFTSARVIEIGQSLHGKESETLRTLWEYCKLHPEHNAIYLHSKGSYTPTEANDSLRQFITKGALSEQCAKLPDSCDVCSSRMTPLPFPHTSGNMWLAKCSYVRKYLMEPKLFDRFMRKQGYACVGGGRYAAERWVHSHPAVRPCDLYTQPDYVWNYEGIPSTTRLEQNLRLTQAPRFDYESYLLPGVCDGQGSLQHLLEEYERVYQATPDSSWWGWKFYNSNATFSRLQ